MNIILWVIDTVLMIYIRHQFALVQTLQQIELSDDLETIESFPREQIRSQQINEQTVFDKMVDLC